MARSVTGRLTGDGSRGIVTTCYRLSVRDISMIERSPSHLYECSWRHYFRPRNVILLSPVYVCCLRVITPFGDPLRIGCIGHVRFSSREQGIQWRPCIQARHCAVPRFRCEKKRFPARTEKNFGESETGELGEPSDWGGTAELLPFVRAHTGSLYAG